MSLSNHIWPAYALYPKHLFKHYQGFRSTFIEIRTKFDVHSLLYFCIHRQMGPHHTTGIIKRRRMQYLNASSYLPSAWNFANWLIKYANASTTVGQIAATVPKILESISYFKCTLLRKPAEIGMSGSLVLSLRLLTQGFLGPFIAYVNLRACSGASPKFLEEHRTWCSCGLGSRETWPS